MHSNCYPELFRYLFSRHTAEFCLFFQIQNIHLLILGTWYPPHIQQWPSLFTTPYWCQQADCVSKLRVFFFFYIALQLFSSKKHLGKKNLWIVQLQKSYTLRERKKNSLSLVSFSKWVLRLGTLWGKSKRDYHFSLSDHFTWKYNGI